MLPGGRLLRAFRSDRFDLDLPAFGGRHARSVGVLAHETASWRAIRDENHSWGNLSLFALEKTLAGLGSDPDGPSREDSDFSHIVWVHDQGGDESLVFGVVFPNVNLLPLLRRAARVHNEASGRHWGRPLRLMATIDLGPIRVAAAAEDTEIRPSEPIAFTGRDDAASFYLFRGQGKGLPDTHFSLAVCHDIQSRADRFAKRADWFFWRDYPAS